MTESLALFTAFQDEARLASGPASHVALSVKAAMERDPNRSVLVFDDASGRQIDFDLRGTNAEVVARLAPGETSGPPPRGRPRLGVVAREVTLLPRHWAWLNQQPGGASVALRKLVEAAIPASAVSDRAKHAREAADRFMLAMAGNQPGYEAASRALYAGRRERFEAETDAWPRDVRDHARRLAEAGLDTAAATSSPGL